MATLKEIRLNANMTQNQMAEIIDTQSPFISNWENDIGYPDLEQILILQNKFSKKIDLKEDLTPLRKHQVVQSIITLTEHLPLPVVLEFCARVYRRESFPDNSIIHYGNVASAEDIEPLTYNLY